MSKMRQRRPKANPFRAVSNERGAVLALIVLMLIVFLGLAALAIDLGMLYVARGEAQRAADAGAHAGAVHMVRNWNAPQAELEAGIKAEAVRVARQNLVRAGIVSIDPDLDDVEILWDEEKVRVHVHRTAARNNAVTTLFARVLGFGRVDVAASAAAEIWPAVAADCVLPLAIPDRWCVGTDNLGNCIRYSDELDEWEGWDPDEHFYRPWIKDWNQQPWEYNDLYTGYSDANIGDEIVIKPQSPQDALQPGWFFPFRIPGNSGGNDYRNSISDCNYGDGTPWGVGDTVYTEQGNMVGPTDQGFRRLLETYDDAEWTFGCTAGSSCVTGDHRHDRIRAVVLFDPSEPPDQGHKPFRIAGFAAMYVDGFDDDGNVVARFVEMTSVKPAPSRDFGGTQLKIIRIVE